MFVLVTYDISNARRLRRAGKVMLKYGARVQYSVYECRLTSARFVEMIGEMKKLINQREDKLSCYSLCDSCRLRICACGSGSGKDDLDYYIY